MDHPALWIQFSGFKIDSAAIISNNVPELEVGDKITFVVTGEVVGFTENDDTVGIVAERVESITKGE